MSGRLSHQQPRSHPSRTGRPPKDGKKDAPLKEATVKDAPVTKQKTLSRKGGILLGVLIAVVVVTSIGVGLNASIGGFDDGEGVQYSYATVSMQDPMNKEDLTSLYSVTVYTNPSGASIDKSLFVAYNSWSNAAGVSLQFSEGVSTSYWLHMTIANSSYGNFTSFWEQITSPGLHVYDIYREPDYLPFTINSTGIDGSFDGNLDTNYTVKMTATNPSTSAFAGTSTFVGNDYAFRVIGLSITLNTSSASIDSMNITSKYFTQPPPGHGITGVLKSIDSTNTTFYFLAFFLRGYCEFDVLIDEHLASTSINFGVITFVVS
jgi:hypothetical protein